MQYLKRLVKSKVGEGIDKTQDSQIDQFVLTRVRNHAELIFNQRPQIDKIERTRFFDMDSSAAWRLSLHQECFMCQRHQYVCIFYERSAVALNTGLIEIRDEQLLAHLKYEYNKEYLLYRTDTPLIRGTVVNRLQSQERFERPLKMMSTPLYTLLSICQSKDFSDNSDQIKHIKQGVLDCLQTDNKQFFENLGLKEKLHGWKHILNDLIHHCELVDVLSINKPDLLQKDIEKKDWFTFGGFFKPDFHQILIYDPKLEKAFCQSFLTNVNQRDFFYPEYPNPIGMQLQKMVPNMWSQWFEDEPEKLEHIFQLCIQSEDFAIEKYIKNQNDIHECLQILGNWMKDLVTYQKIMLTVSNRFPRISFEAAAAITEQIQESKIFQKEFSIIQRAQIELCFIRANRNSGIKGMQSSMRRQELFDFIMRMATAFIQQNFGAKSQICDSLFLFIQKYVLPLTQNSKIHTERAIIRESKRLNELLFDNNKGLVDLFEQAKRFEQEYLPNPLFSLRCAEEFFRQIQQEGIPINYRTVNQNFIYSQMTITDENKNFKKYEYLDFVEFQELLCRVALEIFPDEEGIENSVFKILELFWKSQYDRGLWKQDYMPLHPIVNPILQ